MDILNVFIAGLASYMFGAFWYIALSKPWMAAAGVEQGEDGKPINGSDPVPYILGLVCAVIVAAAMNQFFTKADIIGIGSGAIWGFGIGSCLATPWILTNYGFAGRPPKLMFIDGAYATIGCTIIGTILTLF
ncbi:MAG: DUF1761 domain-containing protein [Pseudomonadota bacterium]